MTNEELIVACQNHRPGAIDQLLKRHKSTIVAMIRKRAPEWTDTQDIVQEAYIRMWKSIRSTEKSSCIQSMARTDRHQPLLR